MAATRKSLSADLQERVGAFCAARLQPDAHLWVGLSGGCDSVVLLHLLSRLGRGKLSAIHVHHGLSPNADVWAAFCADYCERLGIPLVIRHVRVDPASGQGLEAAARAARYAAFAECAGDCLVLAQHRGDQAETVLFNLLRGTGVTGAAGMPAERRFGHLRLLRPLLDVSRAEIECYAAAEGLAWVDDESNADTTLTRNFLRHDTLVAISQRFPAAEASLALAASHFSEAAGLLDELASQDWLLAGDGDSALMPALRQFSPPRLKNLLRHRLRGLGWQVPVAARLEEFARQLVSAAPDRHPELVLPDGKMCVMRGRLFWLSKKQ
ncbi:tRNA lysidine(34) synthetase TilS [Dechloromonas sp. HYN0024]|uniref:tRNA lysidine(34) synthetase TilS n=1 Tax=Dechloromonas sp. HYN0024 TaxID=2231055 RepID=UPI000E42E9A5|nr:tRNA lysidine(34) synthetase TilS [Dechloromonas sp. HYN0024]AXS79239.1 tRNA lysidine(34) synthetase TilS [Dechloromonas sp. HYN0024]